MMGTNHYYTLKDFYTSPDVTDVDNLDELDSFEDIADLDSLEDIDIFEETGTDDLDSIEDIDRFKDIDDLLDRIEDFDANEAYVKPEELICHSINNTTASMQLIGNDFSYSKEIRKFETTLFDIQTTIYDYQLIEPKHMLARFFYMMNKARRDGILCLEEDRDAEPNQLIKILLCMAINGWEPKSIFRVMEMKKKSYKKTFLQYGTTDAKEAFINRVLQDFEAISYGVLYIQSGEEKSEYGQLCSAIYEDDNLCLESEEDFRNTHEEYLNINKPFRLLNESEISHIEVKTKSDIKLLLDVFNKKRDELESIELLTLEDPHSLFNRLLEYNEIVRDNGILNLCPGSLSESNMLLRHAMQQMVFGNSPDDVSEFIQKYKSEKITLVKTHHNETFCILFEKEIDFIETILLAMMGGDTSLYLRTYAIGFYPELPILTEEK